MRKWLCLFVSINSPAIAHDVWANGDPVPAWVKSACCGPDDIHHLKPSQVHLMADGWHVDGYHSVIPAGRELPSVDGDYWIFYRDLNGGLQTSVYCFYTPFSGT